MLSPEVSSFVVSLVKNDHQSLGVCTLVVEGNVLENVKNKNVLSTKNCAQLNKS